MSTRQTCEEMQRVLKMESRPIVQSGETPAGLQSNCILDPGKLLKTGVKLRPVAEAFEDCLDRLRLASRGAKPFDRASRAFLATAH